MMTTVKDFCNVGVKTSSLTVNALMLPIRGTAVPTYMSMSLLGSVVFYVWLWLKWHIVSLVLKPSLSMHASIASCGLSAGLKGHNSRACMQRESLVMTQKNLSCIVQHQESYQELGVCGSYKHIFSLFMYWSWVWELFWLIKDDQVQTYTVLALP